MSTDIRLNSGAGSSIDPAQETSTATLLATGESSAKRLTQTAQEDTEAQIIQKMFAAVGHFFSNATTSTSGVKSTAPTDSLPTLPAPVGGLDLNNLMKALAFETRKQACKDGVNSLENRSKDQEQVGKEQLEELSKQIAAMEKKDFWGGILKIFQWIGTIIGVIASAATLVAGTLSANPALITAGVIGCVMAVESIVSQATDGKVSLLNGFTELFKACGMDEETAKIAGMVVQAVIMVATIAVSVASAVKSAAGTATQLSNAVLTKIMDITMKSQRILNFTSAGLGVAQGSLGIANAVFQNEADKAKASSKELEALMEQVRQAFENEQTLLKNEMERVASLMEKTTELVKDCNRTQSNIVSTTPAMA
ncbi:MAG: type III secretion system translocon subunit SctE [Bilophila sp.]